MLDKKTQEKSKYRFQESVDELDRAIRKAQLMRKIEQNTRESKTASHKKLARIMK